MRRWRWYFQIGFNEYQHWTFPKHNYKRVVTLSVMILENSKREMVSQKYFPVSLLCDLCHNIYHKVVFRPDIFSPDYLWNSNVKIWVWARLVKRADLNGVSTSRWSSHMPQCLRNNWVTRGRHTLVYFTAQTPLRMHKTPPDVTLAATWNNLKHIETVVIKLNTLDLQGYINKIVADMRQAITNHQADLNVVMMVPQISFYSHKTKNVLDMSVGRQPNGFFGISGFAFWQR